MSPELKQAVKLIKSGQKEAGKEILLQILSEDERNDTAWLWMSATVDTDELRLECLDEALRINPNNETAKRGHQKLTQRLRLKEEEELEDVWEQISAPVAQEDPFAQPEPAATNEWSYEGYQKSPQPVVTGEEKRATAVSHTPSTPAKTNHNPLTSSPWLTIWYAPRITVTAILQSNNPHEYVLLIAAAIGILGGFSSIIPLSFLGREYLLIGLISSLILGPIIGIVGLYIGGAVLSWLGFFLGGQGSAHDVRVAIAWAWVPQMVVVLLSIIQLAFFNNAITTIDPLTGMPTISPAVSMLSCLQFILSIWFFYIYLQALGAAHRFSAWRALGTVLMPSVVVGLFMCMLFFLMSITA